MDSGNEGREFTYMYRVKFSKRSNGAQNRTIQYFVSVLSHHYLPDSEH